MADALHFILAFFLAATTIVFFAKAMRLGVVFAPVGELARRIGRANALLCVLLVALMAHIAVTKDGTNTLGGAGSDLPSTNAPSMLASPPRAGVTFSADELAVGYALAAVGTNEVFNFSMPTNAVVAERIAKRGAHEDGFWTQDGNLWIQTDGTVAQGVTRSRASASSDLELQTSNLVVFSVAQCSYGFLPDALWDTCGTSRVWTAESALGDHFITWESALENRNFTLPVTLQTALFADGDIVYRYSRFPSDAQAGVSRNDATLRLEFATNTTSALLAYIGDLSAGPGDTDGDGLTDREEVVVYGTDPRDADTDGDGLADSDDDDPLDWDANDDGIPDGVSPAVWNADILFGANAGYTNVVVTVLRGMEDRTEPTRRLMSAAPGMPPGGVARQKTGSAVLEINGLRLPVVAGRSYALALPVGRYLPYKLHNAERISVELEMSAPFGAPLWLEDSRLFSGLTVLGNAGGRMALPELELVPVGACTGPCVHERPGHRDFRATLAPLAWDVVSGYAAVYGFTLNGDGTLRLTVADDPRSIAFGEVSFSAPFLHAGSIYANAEIHRCEYPVHGYCPLCGAGHDTSGLVVDIGNEVYPVLLGAASATRVALSGRSAAPVNWTIAPQLPDGAKLLVSNGAQQGVFELNGTDTVWVSPGAYSNVTYTVTATCPIATDLSDTAEIVPVSLSLGLLRETRNKCNQIFNPTRKDDSTGNADVLEVAGDESYAAPRNNLYVAASPAGNTFNVSAEINITSPGDPGTVSCCAFDGTSRIEGSEAALSVDNVAEMEIPAPSEAEAVSYAIRAGMDIDGDGAVSYAETVPLKVYTTQGGEDRFAVLRGISNAKYTEHDNGIRSKLFIPLDDPPRIVAPFARSFLSIFYNGDDSGLAAEYASTDERDVQLDAFADGTGFAEWLTHNSGADFSEDGIATIKEYLWDRESAVSRFFAERVPFTPKKRLSMNSDAISYEPTATGASLRSFYESSLRARAEADLADASSGESRTYPSADGWYTLPLQGALELLASHSPTNSPGWVTPSTVDVGIDDGYGGWNALFSETVAGSSAFEEFDAFGAIGRARVLNPKYRFTVTKRWSIWSFGYEYKVTAIDFQCRIQDLYDFNYEDSELSSHAAALQIGYANGNNQPNRTHGKIFRHEIQIRTTYHNPFDMVE